MQCAPIYPLGYTVSVRIGGVTCQPPEVKEERMSAPTPKCVLDRSRPCNSCVADSPAVCPYPYLLSEEAAS